jgi:hypothetical protein
LIEWKLVLVQILAAAVVLQWAMQLLVVVVLRAMQFPVLAMLWALVLAI